MQHWTHPMRRTAILCLGALAWTTGGAAAASDWIVTVGARAQAVTPYEGADYDIFVPTPVIQMRRAGSPERPTLPDDALGVTVASIGGLSFGPALRVRGKRTGEGRRSGLRGVPLAIEPGGFVSLWPTDWLRGHAEVRKGVHGHSGWIGDAALDVVLRDGTWTATFGPRAGWGDHHYMRTYFGVTPAEAAASRIVTSVYRPEGGMRYGGVEATVGRHWSGSWQTTANVGYHRLANGAAQSPIVQYLGSRDEFSGGVGLKYSFGWTP